MVHQNIIVKHPGDHDLHIIQQKERKRMNMKYKIVMIVVILVWYLVGDFGKDEENDTAPALGFFINANERSRIRQTQNTHCIL